MNEQVIVIRRPRPEFEVPHLQEAGVLGFNAEGNGGRKSLVGWLYGNLLEHPDHIEAVNSLKALVELCNSGYFHYDLDKYCLKLVQYAEYHEGDYYNAHTDNPNVFEDNVRKLSFSVVLNPGEFEGGELQFMEPPANPYPKDEPYVVVFPSWMVHRVTEVTWGVRKSLVGWLTGPRWK